MGVSSEIVGAATASTLVSVEITHDWIDLQVHALARLLSVLDCRVGHNEIESVLQARIVGDA